MSHSATFAGQAATIEGEEIYLVSMALPLAEIDEILAHYDRDSTSSPPAADCRGIARPVIEAILASRGG